MEIPDNPQPNPKEEIKLGSQAYSYTITVPNPKPPAFILGAGPYWHLPHINGYIGVPPGHKPGLWRRFWHWALLGWTWVDTTMDELTQ